ncbi:MAG: glycoside hydrolase family 3 N-terminal domain-containing protein [Verrucomicrobiota bacterium]|nr:glycoside hydrolase family 3 N-terminal domain-containing protein [Verrucomicrobiota bacterium]
MFPYKDASLTVAERVRDLLSRMTLEEKAGQLNQLPTRDERLQARIAAGELGSVLFADSAFAGNDKQARVMVGQVNELQKLAVEGSRLGIPLICARDVIHGHTTVAPIPLGQAATWNPPLAKGAQENAARECSADGIRWAFSPMMDIARDPRWGRIAEGFGEDPYLASAFAAASVRGFQSDALPPEERVAACAKHYVGYGAAEGGRDYNTTEITPTTMWNTYLPPFKAAVEAGAMTIMSAFHEVDGIPLAAHKHWLNTVLREHLGFTGAVVTDWGSIYQLIPHGVAGDDAEAALLAILAGNDMDMCTELFYRNLPTLVRTGKLPLAVLDTAVARLLTVKFTLGLFESPYTDPARAARVQSIPAHREAALHFARQSLVLLQNRNNVLPIKEPNTGILLCGPMADMRGILHGTWCLDGDERHTTTLKEAMERLKPEAFKLTHVGLIDDAVKLARWNNTCVIALGESSGRSGEDNCTTTLELPAGQIEQVAAIHAMGIPIIAIVFCGRALALERLCQLADTVIIAWHPGTAGGIPAAEAVYGLLNPSGKLPVTFPRNSGQVPLYYNHKPTGRPVPTKNRYHSRYIDALDSPLFPFGYGMSLTTFAFTALEVDKSSAKVGETINVSVTVTNTGDRTGDTVAQLYLRDPVATISRPVRELKGFRRITLSPGESQTVTFPIGPEELGFYTADGIWCVEPGLFQVWVGDSSEAPLSTQVTLVPATTV